MMDLKRGGGRKGIEGRSERCDAQQGQQVLLFVVCKLWQVHLNYGLILTLCSHRCILTARKEHFAFIMHLGRRVVDLIV
jgi:hypothetical protein